MRPISNMTAAPWAVSGWRTSPGRSSDTLGRVRLQITLDDELVSAVDQRVGRNNRNAFIRPVTREALENERRWDHILSPLGKIADGGHAWDPDVASWVRTQRQGRGCLQPTTDNQTWS